jgi:hypothetical protein
MACFNTHRNFPGGGKVQKLLSIVGSEYVRESTELELKRLNTKLTC